jgi:hypothetical protein
MCSLLLSESSSRSLKPKSCVVRRYLGVNQLSGPLPTWLTIIKQLDQL